MQRFIQLLVLVLCQFDACTAECSAADKLVLDSAHVTSSSNWGSTGSFTFDGCNAYYAQTPASAVDGNLGTAWDGCCQSFPDEVGGHWLSYDLGVETVLGSYGFSTGCGECPEEFTMLGSNDGNTWTEIDEQTEQQCFHQTYSSYPIASPIAYRYIKWTFRTVYGGNNNGVRIHDVALFPSCTDTGACFHGNSTVLLQSGASKSFSELITGEIIKTYNAEGKFSFSPIKTLPHANNDEPAAFLALKTETGKEVEMTSDHKIPKCDLTVVTAGELVVGDCLLTADGKETLMEISWTEKYGVYTAVTEDEFVVVNGVVASSFSKDSHPEDRELDYKKYSMELERMKSSKVAYLSRKATKELKE